MIWAKILNSDYRAEQDNCQMASEVQYVFSGVV